MPSPITNRGCSPGRQSARMTSSGRSPTLPMISNGASSSRPRRRAIAHSLVDRADAGVRSRARGHGEGCDRCRRCRVGAGRTARAAVEVAHLGLGSEFGAPVVGPDGGAWVPIDRSAAEYDRGESGSRRCARARDAGRDFPGCRGRRKAQPDGSGARPGRPGVVPVGLSIDRFDAAGNLTRSELPEPLGDVAATGPDGTLWSADARAGRLLRVDAQGAVTSARLELPACEARSSFRRCRPLPTARSGSPTAAAAG